MTRTRPGLIVFALAGALSATACGSTVQPTADSLRGGGDFSTQDPSGLTAPELGSTGGADGLGGAGATGSGGAAGVASPAGSGGVFSGPAPGLAGGAGAQAPGSPGPAGGGGAAGAGAVGPGVSATSINLGIGYCGDCAAANAAVGVAGEDPGDTRRYARAAIEDVNARGGVLGRKLVPVFHEISAADDLDVSAQEACETFTKDNKVAMMFFQGEVAADCAQKAGVIVAGSGEVEPFFQKYRNAFAPGDVRLDRLGAVTVKALVAAGWQKTEARWPFGKIGMIAWEDADYEYAVERGWKPALQSAGLKAEDTRYVAIPQNAGALADASAAISGAVLAFQAKNIDHVLIVDGPAGIFKGTGLTTLFLQNAQSQGYFPRYGFNGNNAPDSDNYPAEQQSGMLAVENFSIEPANDEGIAPNPQRERCFAIMRKAGLPVGQAQTQTEALSACGNAWFPQAVFEKAGGTTLAAAIAGAEALGTSYRSPFSYGTRLAADQHDGAHLFRSARFDDGCGCMRYTSGAVPF